MLKPGAELTEALQNSSRPDRSLARPQNTEQYAQHYIVNVTLVEEAHSSQMKFVLLSE